MTQIRELEPKRIWSRFDQLCQIPRTSKHEEKVREHIVAFAKAKNFKFIVDDVGNVIIKKEATEGRERARGIVLQAHMDMLPQKKPGVNHDFLSDPIKPYQDGDWVLAEGTSLGADNGIGVAAALALLDSQDIHHGPLEVLFTTDGEGNLTGAKGVSPHVLAGSWLLNIDFEEEGTLCIGSAGGLDLIVSGGYKPESVEDMQISKLVLKGLQGGHSGMDVQLGRGNSNMLMVRLLKALSRSGVEPRIIQMNGGGVANAIPDETTVLLALSESCIEKAAQVIDRYQGIFLDENINIEPGLTLQFSILERSGLDISKECAMPYLLQNNWLNLMHASPLGPLKMCTTVDGGVETSCNFATIDIRNGDVRVEYLIRSTVDSAIDNVVESLTGIYHFVGAEVTKYERYPSWRPNSHSPLVRFMREMRVRLFDQKPIISVVHEGLECGTLAASYPNLDAVSIGPTIRCPHTPYEKVNVKSVGDFWNYLVNVLQNVPNI